MTAVAHGGCARGFRHGCWWRRQLGQAEVEDLRLPAAGDEDVGRLDVAVDDAGRCARRRARRRSGWPCPAPAPGRMGLPCDAVLQRLAFQALHDDEGLALVLADVVDGADVRMVQGGGGAGLALEALERLLIAGELRRQELEGHEAAQARVLGLVDHAHAAAAQLVDDAIVRDRPADQMAPSAPCVGSRMLVRGGGTSQSRKAWATRIRNSLVSVTPRLNNQRGIRSAQRTPRTKYKV